MTSDIPELCKQIKKSVADRLIKTIQIESDFQDKPFSGKGNDSWTYDESLSVVGSDLIYMPNIEWGRLPAPIPFEPLHQWVIGKLGLEDPDAIAVTKSIQHKIETEGIQASRVVKISLVNLVKGNWKW